MKFILFILCSLFASQLFSTDPIKKGHGDIIIEINNIEDIKGELYVGLYNSKRTFRKYKKVFRKEIVKVDDKKSVVIISNVPHDTYAIALFQDFNGNKKVDKNYLGAPKEPFGFSKNFIVKRKAPKYKQVTFQHNDADTEMTISLQKFSMF